MTHPLHCDPDTGACPLPTHHGHATAARPNPAAPHHHASADLAAGEPVAHRSTPPVTLHLFTDPICSACWALEPHLRRLEQDMGPALRVVHHHGGLLRSWRHMAHAPINAPHQVAHHWEEMARHLGMPMTGAVWHTDPLDSSDRPARAVHAAAQQRPDRALPFLRRLREALFLAGQNITRDAVLAEAARAEGLDPQQLLADTDDPRGAAWARFEADLALGEALGVRAFPTMRLTAPDVPARVITGLRPWRALQNEVLRVIGTLTGGVAGTTGSPTAGAADLAPTAGGGAVTDLDALTTLLAQHDSWTAPEVAVACDRAIPDTHHLLARAEQQGRLVRLALPGGPLWRKP